MAGNSLLSPASAGSLRSYWTAQLGGAIVTQPIVVNNTVYIGSEDGYEYAFNETTGAQIWKTYLGNTTGCGFTDGVSSTPTYDNGTLYLGGGDAYWYAMNAQTGNVLWRVFVGNNSGKVGGGNYNWASPLLYDGSAYIGVASHCDKPLVPGGLLEVDLTTHQVVARFNTTSNAELGASIWGTPAVDTATGTIYVTTGNGPVGDAYAEAIIALNASTLRVTSYWTVPTTLHVADGDFGTTPTLFQDAHGHPLVGATNKDGYFFAFNRRSLSHGPVWELRISTTSSVSSASYGQGLLFVGGSKTKLGGVAENGSVRAVSATSGQAVWAVGFPGPVFAATSYADGVVAAAGGNVFRVLSAQNGSILFQYTGPGTTLKYEFQGAPTIVHDRIYVGDDNGRLYAFGLPPSVPRPSAPD
ncbi:MAG TPA: PQQ-binding-like beta-propeller repeat protein [Thermoplasmata archaeon]|nr:PQQ-binding-like beta-propeller repeat protein [Thermoplasmata archaeon]